MISYSKPHCTSVLYSGAWLLYFSRPTLKYLLFVLETPKLGFKYHIADDLLTEYKDQPKAKWCNKLHKRQLFFWLFILISYSTTQKNHLWVFWQRNLPYNMYTIPKNFAHLVRSLFIVSFKQRSVLNFQDNLLHFFQFTPSLRYFNHYSRDIVERLHWRRSQYRNHR